MGVYKSPRPVAQPRGINIDHNSRRRRVGKMAARFPRQSLAEVQIARSIPEDPRNNVPGKVKGLAKTGLADSSDRNSGCPVARFARHLNPTGNLANLRRKIVGLRSRTRLSLGDKFLAVSSSEFPCVSASGSASEINFEAGVRQFSRVPL